MIWCFIQLLIKLILTFFFLYWIILYWMSSLVQDMAWRWPCQAIFELIMTFSRRIFMKIICQIKVQWWTEKSKFWGLFQDFLNDLQIPGLFPGLELIFEIPGLFKGSRTCGNPVGMTISIFVEHWFSRYWPIISYHVSRVYTIATHIMDTVSTQ